MRRCPDCGRRYSALSAGPPEELGHHALVRLAGPRRRHGHRGRFPPQVTLAHARVGYRGRESTAMRRSLAPRRKRRRRTTATGKDDKHRHKPNTARMRPGKPRPRLASRSNDRASSNIPAANSPNGANPSGVLRWPGIESVYSREVVKSPFRTLACRRSTSGGCSEARDYRDNRRRWSVAKRYLTGLE